MAHRIKNWHKQINFAAIFQKLIHLWLGLGTVLLVGCAIYPMRHVQRFEGHWSVGAPYSEFAVKGSGDVYWFNTDHLPQQVKDFFDSQPRHPSAGSESGDEQSIYLVLDGYLTPMPPGDGPQEQINIRKIIRFEPAHSDFIASKKGPNSSSDQAVQPLDLAKMSLLERAVIQLPPAAVADIPIDERQIFLAELSNDTPRLDVKNGFLHFYSDGETLFHASSMLYMKLFAIRGGGHIVFCHMPKPQADGGHPRPGQTFVFKQEGAEWIDVTHEYIPSKIDIQSCFVPRRSKDIVEGGTYNRTLVKAGGGHDYVRQFDLIWNGQSFDVVKAPSREFSYDDL